MALEKEVVKRIRKILENNGGYTLKIHGSPTQMGEPDILCCLPVRFGDSVIGIMVAIECKQPGKKPTVMQMERLKIYERKGAIAFWSSDPTEVMKIVGMEVKLKLDGKGFTCIRDGRPLEKHEDNRAGNQSEGSAESNISNEMVER